MKKVIFHIIFYYEKKRWKWLHHGFPSTIYFIFIYNLIISFKLFKNLIILFCIIIRINWYIIVRYGIFVLIKFQIFFFQDSSTYFILFRSVNFPFLHFKKKSNKSWKRRKWPFLFFFFFSWLFLLWFTIRVLLEMKWNKLEVFSRIHQRLKSPNQCHKIKSTKL